MLVLEGVFGEITQVVSEQPIPGLVVVDMI